MIAGLLNEVYGNGDEMEFFTILSYVNPYINLWASTAEMFLARGMFTFSWPLHCGVMLAGAALILAVSVSRVRKVALLQATGQLDGSLKRRIFKKSKGAPQAEYVGRIKRVKGPAVLWKELRSPIFGRRKLKTFIILFIGLVLLFITYIGLVLLFITYALFEGENNLDDEEVHMMYTCVFMSIGLLFTTIMPATSITSEKESLSWPILLATPLSDGKIMSGKFIGAIRRSLPIWILLFGHIILFSLVGYIHPFAIFMMAVVVAGIIVLLCGSGIYFSTRFKKTTTAVVMNFSFAALIWAIIPFMIALILGISGSGDDMLENYCDIIPFVQGVMVMDFTAGNSGSLDFDVYWPSGEMGIVASTFLMIVFMLSYMLAGLLFAWRAKCRFRKHIF
jgi:ABC-type transport system involved in multi-copper enzyme maturation permease subunit